MQNPYGGLSSKESAARIMNVLVLAVEIAVYNAKNFFRFIVASKISLLVDLSRVLF